LSSEERTALLNFLVAPDGQRLFATNCAACHGRAPAFSGEEDELRTLISQGGLHLEMPPWREMLNDVELDQLSRYVVDPASVSGGQELFTQYCSAVMESAFRLWQMLNKAQSVPAARTNNAGLKCADT
jgi:hypothetical protein